MALYNLPSWIARVVTVAVVGTPVQGPDLLVPDGLNLVVKAGSGNLPGRLVFVGPTAADATNPALRISLSPGAILLMRVQNASSVFADSQDAGGTVEFAVEQ